MAKLWVTIDRLDGTTTVKGPYYPDEIDTRGLLFKLSESSIASVTFTNAEPLKYLAEHSMDTGNVVVDRKTGHVKRKDQ